ncbi:hypothetical protein NMY22_g1692 [Coprinellus aureogranulatus]|nr:hypothetical protein NMY22_g1692 [Coprinellus aureogranulatus]
MGNQDVPATSSSRRGDEARMIASTVEMRKTLENLIGNTKQLELQSKEFNETASKPAISVSMQADLDVDAPTLEKLRTILQGHNAEHGTNLDQVKKELVEEFKKQFEGRIRKQVRESLVAEIKVQVDKQILEHVPVALRTQLDDAKAQLREVKLALKNSEARTRNGMLEATDLNEPLAVVLTTEGKRSELYPVDMCSLLAYDRALQVETLKALVKDYGLAESDDFEENFSTFLTYIVPIRYSAMGEEYSRRPNTDRDRRMSASSFQSTSLVKEHREAPYRGTFSHPETVNLVQNPEVNPLYVCRWANGDEFSVTAMNIGSNVAPGPADPVSNLKLSSNNIAAGIGEALEALVLAATTPPTTTKPIFVEWESRIMALGRKRMAGLGSGKVRVTHSCGSDKRLRIIAVDPQNALLYLKSKFGLLSSPRPVYLQASFLGETDGEFVEVDLDAWEELVPHIDRLRIIT